LIRASRTLRPDAACHSADVLTPTERAAEFARPDRLVFRERDMKWGDEPAIRAVLQKIRGDDNAPKQ